MGMKSRRQRVGFISSIRTLGDVISTTFDFVDAVFSLGAKVLLELGKIFLIILGIIIFIVSIKALIGNF